MLRSAGESRVSLALVAAPISEGFASKGEKCLTGDFSELIRSAQAPTPTDVAAEIYAVAVALYERVGMHVDACGVAFEKELE